MNGKYLLDTNIVIDLFNGKKQITNLLETIPQIFISNITIGELYYGSFKSRQKDENIKKIEEFVINSSIPDSNIDTSKIYGLTKSELSKKGKPIPENDIWIASIAIQYSLTLLSKDLHFKHIENLSSEIL
ncbi:MAG: type II toxin-antitoxin system VapC family toxin [Spirochaetota bacterium]